MSAVMLRSWLHYLTQKLLRILYKAITGAKGLLACSCAQTAAAAVDVRLLHLADR